MTSTALSADTQATALLVGRFGKGSAKPLTRTDFNKVAQTLHQRGLRPSDLFQQVPGDLPVDEKRISGLISRGTALAVAVESWNQIGIRVVSRADPSYPVRFRRLLKGGSTPILYYAGNLSLLDRDTVSVVGSRDATDAGLRFAQAIAERAAREDVVIVSGDARGVDRAAMEAALDNGGKVVGILADSLAKAVLSKRYRQAIAGGSLLLLSHVEPDARFSVGQAMERNRYIYSAGDIVIVADSDVKGGTWNGAIENRKHRWAPSYVRIGEDAREGNAALLDAGLIRIDGATLGQLESLKSLFVAPLAKAATLPLFATSEPAASPAPVPQAVAEKSQVSDRDQLFAVFRDRLRSLFGGPKGAFEVANHFGLELAQAEAWLRRAAEAGDIEQTADLTWTYQASN